MSEHLTMELVGDSGLIIRRSFKAKPEAVFRAHMEPELLRQWCTGPDGWKMTKCELEAKPGGAIHYAWENDEGHGFSLTGEFVEIDAPHRTVHIERMHLPDPTPDNRIETTFEAKGVGTLITMRMQLPDAQTREQMLASGMDAGMEISYQRLDKLT